MEEESIHDPNLLESFEDEATFPFKIGKSTIDYLVSKYLSRKLCEEVDLISSKGGIR
jgi:hypothetical protein